MVLALLAAGLGGCAQRPQEVAVSHGKEYFPSSVYGRASRRVIVDGQPVPRGGGQYLVGKPYTIAGRTYYPSESRRTQIGTASWYGDAFHGRMTANGEIYDRGSFTAASPVMPLPSYVRVTNLRNNYSMIVRVNDRGPYASNRIMDVSSRVADALDFKRYGTTQLKVEYVGRASLSGSDDAKLYATLHTNGPASWQQPTMVAEAAPRARVASLAPYVPQPRGDADFARRPQRLAVDEQPTGRIPRRRESEALPARRMEVFAREPRGAPRGQLPPRRMEAAAHAQRSGSDRSFESRETARATPRGTVRVARESDRHPLLPPSRPMDLGTIPGAGSQIRARRESPHLRMARARDD